MLTNCLVSIRFIVLKPVRFVSVLCHSVGALTQLEHLRYNYQISQNSGRLRVQFEGLASNVSIEAFVIFKELQTYMGRTLTTISLHWSDESDAYFGHTGNQHLL